MITLPIDGTRSFDARDPALRVLQTDPGGRFDPVSSGPGRIEDSE
jgi:hypothetical protein